MGYFQLNIRQTSVNGIMRTDTFKLTQDLNELGKSGWELLLITPSEFRNVLGSVRSKEVTFSYIAIMVKRNVPALDADQSPSPQPPVHFTVRSEQMIMQIKVRIGSEVSIKENIAGTVELAGRSGWYLVGSALSIPYRTRSYPELVMIFSDTFVDRESIIEE